MKSVDQIEDRVRLLLQNELQRRLDESQEKLPHRCTHNHRQPLDTRRLLDGEPNPLFNRTSRVDSEGQSLPVVNTIGLCMLNSDGDEWLGTICEDAIDAQRCPYFQPRQTSEEIYHQFRQDLENEQWVVVNLPRIQPLLWVLGSRYEGLDEEPELPARLPWWERVWRVLRGLPEVPEVPQLAEGASTSVKVYLPLPGAEVPEDVDENDDSVRADVDDREGTSSDGRD